MKRTVTENNAHQNDEIKSARKGSDASSESESINVTGRKTNTFVDDGLYFFGRKSSKLQRNGSQTDIDLEEAPANRSVSGSPHLRRSDVYGSPNEREKERKKTKKRAEEHDKKPRSKIGTKHEGVSDDEGAAAPSATGVVTVVKVPKLKL